MTARDGVQRNELGHWDIFLSGDKIGSVETQREAWRVYDKAAQEPVNRAQDTSDWISRKNHE